MTNNSEGLSPTLRPQLGVGWNRALPAPFGFDNGLYLDGVNDYIEIPGLSGKKLSEISPLTFEVWGKNQQTQGFRGFLVVNFTNGSRFEIRTSASVNNFGINVAGSSFTGNAALADLLSVTSKWTFTFTLDFLGGVSQKYLNGLRSNTPAWNLTVNDDPTVASAWIFRTQAGAGWETPVDELRIYHRYFSAEESRLNWNDGVGNNPAKTEGLIVYYKFQEFENLDFSLLQDNSDIRLGIRDLSGNNNHALPVNMDTNPASPNYVLKPF